MQNDIHDISDTIIASSDQLNAGDLIAGPITVTITSVKRSNGDQPVAVSISGHKDWFPCKTMRRLLIMAWPEGSKNEGGKTSYDPTCWVGRSVTLIRDPNVKWAGELVGGIRVAALSHIKAKFEVALSESKKKRTLVTVEKLDASQESRPKTEQPKQSNGSPIAARLATIKDEWKSRRTRRQMSATLQDWKDFVVAATEGCVSAENSLKAEAFTVEVLAKVEEFLNFEYAE